MQQFYEQTSAEPTTFDLQYKHEGSAEIALPPKPLDREKRVLRASPRLHPPLRHKQLPPLLLRALSRSSRL